MRQGAVVAHSKYHFCICQDRQREIRKQCQSVQALSRQICNRRLPNIKPQVHGCPVLKWTCGRRYSRPAVRYNPIINSILFHCFREFWIYSRNIRTVISQLLVLRIKQEKKSFFYVFAPCIVNIIITYKPMKCTFLKLIFNF